MKYGHSKNFILTLKKKGETFLLNNLTTGGGYWWNIF